MKATRGPTKKEPRVLGRMVHLDKGRIVFLGARDDMPVHFVAFKNQMGSVLKFTISDDALDTLMQLRSDPGYGEKGEFPMPKQPAEFEWKVIEDAAAPARKPDL